MRWFPFAVTTILFMPGMPVRLLAQNVAPQERLQEVAKASSLIREDSKPWHLRMSFQLFDLKGKPTESGTVEEWWAAPGVFRRVVTSPSYTLTLPGPAEATDSHRRETYLSNLLINEVTDPIPHYGDYKNLTVTRGTETLGKVKLDCYTVYRDGPPSAADYRGHPEFCVDVGNSDLRIHFDAGPLEAVRNHIAKFRDVILGMDDILSYDSNQAIAGHVEALEGWDPATASFDMTHINATPPTIPGVVLAGKIVRKTVPDYPSTARQEHIGGTVTLSALISKEGKIADLEVIASPDERLAKSAFDAVKQWVYTPYLLNGAATEIETTITVNYNTGIRVK